MGQRFKENRKLGGVGKGRGDPDRPERLDNEGKQVTFRSDVNGGCCGCRSLSLSLLLSPSPASLPIWSRKNKIIKGVSAASPWRGERVADALCRSFANTCPPSPRAWSCSCASSWSCWSSSSRRGTGRRRNRLLFRLPRSQNGGMRTCSVG